MIESFIMTCARSYAWLLNFLSKREGLDCFSQPNVLPKISKIIDFPKVGKTTINFEILKISKMTTLKIYISPVMEKLETSSLDGR